MPQIRQSYQFFENFSGIIPSKPRFIELTKERMGKEEDRSGDIGVGMIRVRKESGMGREGERGGKRKGLGYSPHKPKIMATSVQRTDGRTENNA